MWKLGGKIKKEQWLLLLLAGAVLMILAMPAGKRQEKGTLYDAGTEKAGTEESSRRQTAEETGFENPSYAAGLEERVKEILKNVEGVGQVDVMIALKSTEENVLQTDQSISSSSTKEQDAAGGSREILQSESEETTVLTDTDEGSRPIIQKQLYPEISGIVISASGGGSPQVKAEISEAMEALFGLPAHKIKVLKRVE